MFKFLNKIRNPKDNTEVNAIKDNYNIEEIEFVRKQMAKGITIKSSIMEFAAIKKGLNVRRLSNRVIIVSSGTKTQAFHQMNGVSSSRVGKFICDNKQYTRELLKRSDLNIVESKIFNENEFEKASKYVKELSFPVVVKPTTLARARGVTTNIQDMETFKAAWERAIKEYKSKRTNRKILIEKHFHGEDFRLYVVDGKCISATHKKRPHVVGDGKSTIFDLIKEKNKARLKNPYLEDHLIPEDYSLLDKLQEQNLSLDYIPKKGEEITLRKLSNMHAGGENNDLTDKVHPEFMQIAVKAVEAIPGIKYGGVDIIAPDITVKPNKSNHIVSEVEFAPAPLAHFPFKGKKIDMASAVIDYYFK